MMILVTGGSGSGKSEYAEELILNSGLSERWYIATMKLWGPEEEAKARRHQLARRGKGFATLEQTQDLDQIDLTGPPEGRAALLECVTNLVANELFRQDAAPDLALERVMRGVEGLKDSCELLVAVTGELASDGVSYERETMDYIRLMGEVNCRLAQMADRVIEVVYGILLPLKDRKEEREDVDL